MLEFAKKEICAFLNKNSINELVFIPYAQNNFNEYTKKIKDIIDPWGFSVTGVAGAVLFKKGQKKTEYCVGDNVSFLFEE
ncbi:unnamed protein product, partial [Iphiclides podalirius]